MSVFSLKHSECLIRWVTRCLRHSECFESKAAIGFVALGVPDLNPRYSFEALGVLRKVAAIIA
jgi:hypothetical protein